MNISHIGVIGYSNNYIKFLQILNKNKYYKLEFIHKLNKSIDDEKIIKNYLNKKIKFLVLCDQKYKKTILKNIDLLIKQNIVLVRASTNKEILNHGFIVQKPFIDFSFDDIFLRKKLNIYKSNLEIFENKKILITGGCGSIGSNLVLILSKIKGIKIFVVDTNEYNTFGLLNLKIEKKYLSKINIKNINIENELEVINYIKDIKPYYVFNTAAVKHVKLIEENPLRAIKTNIVGTANVLKGSSQAKVKGFIHVSTDKAAEPINLLGITKKVSELIARKYSKKINMKVGIVRFGNVFDSFGSVSELFRHNILNNKKISISNPDVERFFMSKLEATNFLITSLNLLLKNKYKNQSKLYIYDMGKPIKIIELAKKMIFLSGRDISKNINKKFYLLNKNEKISETLIGKNEKIIMKHNDGISEVAYINDKINKLEIPSNINQLNMKNFLHKIKKYVQ